MLTKEQFTPQIPDRLYFKIGEVSQLTGVETYVLRYWETEFDELKPDKSKANQRVYEKRDIENILRIKQLLWKERFSIEGARQRLKELKKEHRKMRASEENSPANQKLKTLKRELKDLVQFCRSN
ncbi:MAG: MerR family transcriptional regulator [Deltaproteobacteria bacterium]|nr:MerR family transcriptional regulator [Deltaproteobacteria bacterium]